MYPLWVCKHAWSSLAMLDRNILIWFVTFSSSLPGKLNEMADSATAGSSNCTTLYMVQKNAAITTEIADKKKARLQKRKEVQQETAELKLLKAKKKRLQKRVAGMSRDQMMCMWSLWEEGDRKKALVAHFSREVDSESYADKRAAIRRTAWWL